MSAEAQLPAVDAVARPAEGSGLWAQVDRALRLAGDHLNPILVKETRQALKSKQFVITFALLLVLSWGWTILAVAWIGPQIYYTSQGADVFMGYYVILSFPVLVIVPYGAFRSLAGEQEDRTYELLSITTLNPRQIVRGKLGSSVLQMLIYLSAVTPCLAFTYMLRGIDFPTILFIVFWTTLASLAFSVIALLLSTLTSEKHWQVVLSVLVIAALLLALVSAWGIVGSILDSPGQVIYFQPEFWQVNAAVLTAYVSYFVLVFYAAAAQLSFASDNRSTRLRIVMLAQQLLFTGWMAWGFLGPGEAFPPIIAIFFIIVAIHWGVMGALMGGESPELSARVKRALPQSFLGRMFLTWFNPGPGTGYVLAAGSLAAAVVLGLFGLAIGPVIYPGSRWATFGANSTASAALMGPVAIGYVAFYAGLGLLLVRLLRRFTATGVFLALLIQVLVVLLLNLVPWVVQSLLLGPVADDWTFLQITGCIWTTVYILDSPALPAEWLAIVILVDFLGGLMFAANLPAVVREVRHVRIEKPRRVVEEEAAAAPPAEPAHISPWD